MPDILKYVPKDSCIHSWLHAYEEDEAPKSYQILAALAALGSALKRKVHITWKLSQVTYPDLNIFLLGPPGIGKSESLKHVRDELVPYLPGSIACVKSTTKEALIKTLQAAPHAILYAPEMANFISKDKYKDTLPSILTELLEGEEKWEGETTISRGPISLDKLFVTMLGGTTVEYFHDGIPPSALEGGFLCRFLLVLEEREGQIVNKPRFNTDLAFREEIYKRLREAKQNFLECATFFEGEIAFHAWDFEDVLAPWLTARETRTGRMSYFDSRCRQMILRLCMILAMSCKATKITAEHIRAAIGIYTDCMDSIEPIIEKKGEQARNQLACLDHITTGRGTLTLVDVYQRMSHMCPATEVDKSIASLLASQLIKVGENGRLRSLERKKKNAS